jgi:crotonobetainyl-CoA:carnitine CoA-transferase CaiB-like acyl-CoA transferase
VTRAETPDGHPLARRASDGSSRASSDSPLRAWLSRRVETVIVDPVDRDDLAALRRWIAAADAILCDDRSPFAGDGSTLYVSGLTSMNPEAIVVALSPFGVDGVWANRPATESTLQALSGGPATRGIRSDPPIFAGGQLGDYVAGMFQAVAAMIGLRTRAATGTGGVYDVSALESLIMTQQFNPVTTETMANGVAFGRPESKVADVVRTTDGWVGFALVNRVQHWQDFCRMIGHNDWADDVSLNQPAGRFARADELNADIERWVAARTTAEIVELGNLWRIPTAEVGNGETLPQMDHLRDGEYFQVDRERGSVEPTEPWRTEPPLVATGQPESSHHRPGPIRRIPAPPPHAETRPPSLGGAPAFEGVRVADFTSFWAGPLATHTLALFGADVIHVESITHPNGSRTMGYAPHSDPLWLEKSPYFVSTSTNKRSIALEMSHPQGRELALELIRNCDVVVENFSPRVFDEWGLDWRAVRSVNPRAVMVRMPAFGVDGPWRDRTAFTMTMEQLSGMSWVTGAADGPPVTLSGPCDPIAAIHAAVALIAALDQRDRTGSGVYVEVPMIATALNVTGQQVVDYSTSGSLSTRIGNRGATCVPQNAYPTADYGVRGESRRWVAIAVETDAQWDALLTTVGHDRLVGVDRLATRAARRRHEDEIDAVIADWCRDRRADEIVGALTERGVPVAPVLFPVEQLTLPPLMERGFFEDVTHPAAGSCTCATFPFRAPHRPRQLHRRAAPLLGQDTVNVLHEVLGLSEERIAGLLKSGCVTQSKVETA